MIRLQVQYVKAPDLLVTVPYDPFSCVLASSSRYQKMVTAILGTQSRYNNVQRKK